VAYSELKDYQKALADSTQAISLQPDLAATYYNRALIYYDLKDYQKALTDIEKATQLFCQQGSPKCQQAQEWLRQLQSGGN
jgi:tetratricopeptide (TPR) repeat protein